MNYNRNLKYFIEAKNIHLASCNGWFTVSDCALWVQGISLPLFRVTVYDCNHDFNIFVGKFQLGTVAIICMNNFRKIRSRKLNRSV